MKSLLPILLLVSVIGNVALAVYSLRERSDQPAVSIGSTTNTATSAVGAPAAASSAATAAKSSSSAAAPAWRAPRTDADLRGLIDHLRAAGYPPSVLRAVANQLLQERYASSRPDANLPFWKRPAQTQETVAAELARNAELTASREAVLGADGLPAASLNPIDRARRYGNLSDEKINALIKLEREHNDVRSMAFAGRERMGADNFSTAMQQQQLLEKEKQADIASVLTPAELEAYEMRSSPSANRLQNSLRTTDVTEEEYAALYKLQKYNDENNPTLGGQVTQEAMIKRQAAQAALNEQARVVLGDDRFYQYLESADSQYGNVTRFTSAYPSVTPATSYQLYQLQNELQATMQKMTQNRDALNSADRVAEMRATIQGYNDRLTSLLGNDVAEAYKKQGMGRMFNSFTTPAQRSGTTTTTTPSAPTTGNGAPLMFLPGRD